MFQIQIYNQEFNLEHSATEFSNVIQLLAVSEDENGNITSASQIPLHLTIIEGSGEIFVNLNSYTEIDTQISITNSNEVICTLLELSCNNYDFYYSFEDASLVLRGPSASTSIAVLTYATVNGIILDDSFALTGALNSNGIIGIVGGVEEKAKKAQRENMEKVFVPLNSINSSIIETELQDIEVIESLDIIDVLSNLFSDYNTTLSTTPFSNEMYAQTMKFIADELCSDSLNYLEQISELNISLEDINSSINQVNNSKIAQELEEYYSQGSFCYSANLGLKSRINIKNLNSSEKIVDEIEILLEQIENKELIYDSIRFSKRLSSLNEIYVFLLVKDRLSQTKDYLNSSQDFLNQLNEFNLSNTSNENNNSQELNETELLNLAVQQLSFAQERYNTVLLWETLFNDNDNDNSKPATLPLSKAQEICQIYIVDVQTLNQLLNQYEVDFFNDQVENLQELFFQDAYECIYTSLELKGQMNSIVAGNSIENDEDLLFLVSKLQNISISRMEFHSQGQLPLIPYISYEYSKTLQEVGNLQSALRYAYSAVSYAELNILLDSTNKESDNFNIGVIQYQNSSNQELLSYIFLILGVIFLSVNIKIVIGKKYY